MRKRIIFDDTTDYLSVLKLNKLMFGELACTAGCCPIERIAQALCCGSSNIYAAQLALDNSDPERFQFFVKSAYNCLFPYTEKEYEVSTIFTAYFGNNSDGSIPDIDTILSSSQSPFQSGGPITVQFDNTGIPAYSWLAYPISEAIKTHWQDTIVPYNQGEIGSPTDLFGALTVVGDFDVIITNYATIFDNPIEFT